MLIDKTNLYELDDDILVISLDDDILVFSDDGFYHLGSSDDV